MIEAQIKNAGGSDAGTYSVEADTLGGKVKKRLMHSAVVQHLANQRQGSASTRNRSAIAGSNRKLYRQKGTGRARAGSKKSGIRVGGGRIFGPTPRDFSYHLPKKQRRAALKSALLTKFLDKEIVVVDSFGINEVKTKNVVELLNKLGLSGQKVLIATAAGAREVYLSGRNIHRVTVKEARDLNCFDVLNTKFLLIEKAELDTVIETASRSGKGRVSAGSDESSDSPEAKAKGDEAPAQSASETDGNEGTNES